MSLHLLYGPRDLVSPFPLQVSRGVAQPPSSAPGLGASLPV